MEHETPGAGRKGIRRIRTWRRLLFFLQTGTVLGLPFFTVDGRSALRFDIPTLHLYFFGHTLFIQDFFLLLLATLAMVFLFVFFTTVLGRLWCGWFCPQSTLLELQTLAVSGLRRVGLSGNILDGSFYLFSLGLSLLVSASLIWYFVPPWRMLELLRAGTAEPGGFLVRGFWIGQAMLIFVITGIFGRRFCRSVCPYAKLQGVLFDDRTMIIAFEEGRRNECMGCDYCVRVCPTGIDIKNGLQIECVACAECLDACRIMTRQRGIPSLIHYSFGKKKMRRPQLLLSGGAALLFFGLLFVVARGKGDVDLNLSRKPGELFRTGRNGEIINLYRLSVQNRSDQASRYRITLEPENGLDIAGNREIVVEARRRMVFEKAVVAQPGSIETETPVVFILTGRDGATVRRETVFFSP